MLLYHTLLSDIFFPFEYSRKEVVLPKKNEIMIPKIQGTYFVLEAW